jgi:hypothetical protein
MFARTQVHRNPYVCLNFGRQPALRFDPHAQLAVCAGRRLKLLVNGIFLVGKALECMYSSCQMRLFYLLYITVAIV